MFDEGLAHRVRETIGARSGIQEKRMFGGLAFLLDGNMAVAVSGRSGGLLVRVDPADEGRLLAEPGVSPMVMGGRPTRGWLVVQAQVLDDAGELGDWVREGLEFAATLPAKAESTPRSRRQ